MRAFAGFFPLLSILPGKKIPAIASRAYEYLSDYFTDSEHGSIFWYVDTEGHPLVTRKQVYGVVFYLYGLSEYCQTLKDPDLLEQAVRLFLLIEEKSFDTSRKSYYGAFAGYWQHVAYMRLSDKDANDRKAMNTHLHIIKAYAWLYKQWLYAVLRQRIV